MGYPPPKSLGILFCFNNSEDCLRKAEHGTASPLPGFFVVLGLLCVVGHCGFAGLRVDLGVMVHLVLFRDHSPVASNFNKTCSIGLFLLEMMTERHVLPKGLPMVSGFDSEVRDVAWDISISMWTFEGGIVTEGVRGIEFGAREQPLLFLVGSSIVLQLK